MIRHAARDLGAAGIEAEHAEAIAEGMRQAAGADRDELATKADLAELRADLYRAFASRAYRWPASGTLDGLDRWPLGGEHRSVERAQGAGG